MTPTVTIDTAFLRPVAFSLTTSDAARRLINIAKAKAGAAIKFGVVGVLSPVVTFSVMCVVGGAMNLVLN